MSLFLQWRMAWCSADWRRPGGKFSVMFTFLFPYSIFPRWPDPPSWWRSGLLIKGSDQHACPSEICVWLDAAADRVDLIQHHNSFMNIYSRDLLFVWLHNIYTASSVDECTDVVKTWNNHMTWDSLFYSKWSCLMSNICFISLRGCSQIWDCISAGALWLYRSRRLKENTKTEDKLESHSDNEQEHRWDM